MRNVILCSILATIISGCAIPLTKTSELDGRTDSDSVLLVAKGESYVASVDDGLGIMLREIDGVSIPLLKVGTPATQILPGKRILSGTLETPRRIKGGMGSWKSWPFSVSVELEAGWIYMLTLDLSQSDPIVKAQKLCRSTDHMRTYSSLVQQKLLYNDVVLSSLKCE